MAGPAHPVTLRARPWRAALLLALSGPGVLLFLVAFVAWFVTFVPAARWSDPLFGGFIVPLVAVVAAFILPEVLWRTHTFARYVRGTLWFTLHPSGIETGWDGMHSWFQLTELRLGRWAYTGGRGWDYITWLLEYRVRGIGRRTVLDLAVFGEPNEVAARLEPLLSGHGAIKHHAGGAPRTWRAALGWLRPTRPG